MSRPSISTPCPAPARRINTLPAFEDNDDTSQIEYTRVIQREFAHARPRRPGKRDVAPKVFEDVAEDQEMHRFEKREEGGGRGVLLGKRPTKRVPLGGVAQGRASIAPTNAVREDISRPVVEDEKAGDAAKRDLRRRTIYVPSDDTTLMTIHPGANTTHRLDDTFQLPAYQPQSLLDCVSRSSPAPEDEAHHSPAKKPRMSLAAAPRRAPLGQIEAKSLNMPALDMVGEGGGKENLPPGYAAGDKFAVKGTTKSVEAAKPSIAKSRLFEPTAASQLRQTVQSRKAVPLTRARPSPRAPVVSNPSKPRAAEIRDASRAMRPRTSLERDRKEPSPRVKAPAPPKPWRKNANFVSASDASRAKLQQYQVLSEDVSRPDLYEDSWLDQQEVALTEVINQIFQIAEPSAFDKASTAKDVRESLLGIYDQPQVAMLHKRLQASLCYGALSIPKDMPSPPDLTQDLGLRRRFVQLWMESYNLDTLRAAAEVVVGRKMPEPRGSSQFQDANANSRSMDPKESRRAVIGFLETFLVTVDDIEADHGSHKDTQMQRRNKTVLRSLMLVWLLDQAAVSGYHSTRLFKLKSAHKSSASVLTALAGMLIPSIGDIGRALKHMDYTVDYIQDPLDEVVYRIDNLAVDLRDGVMLNKLVELLLYHTPTKVWERLDGEEETVTIVLPDATVLQSALYTADGVQQNRILVQHLKMPALGHAQKMYNVDIALQALAGHPRTAEAVAANTTAETIVNGHRENTLNLLWSLVSSIGLDVLLDKKALISDIIRLETTSADLDILTIDTLLQKWAAAYCAPHRINIENLTTSFASGEPYSAIVASFSDFFAPTDSRASLGGNTASRLHAMGCSEAFVKQLTATTSAIPTRQTTLANLAFLASRLVPLAKRYHAAATIQRAFRARWARVVLKQRVALMKMAADCAKVVRTQQRIVDAAVVMQRAWRSIVRTRVQRLENEVTEFQVLARGWVQRRKVGAAKKKGTFSGRIAGW